MAILGRALNPGSLAFVVDFSSKILPIAINAVAVSTLQRVSCRPRFIVVAYGAGEVLHDLGSRTLNTA